ncbi:MAG: succinate dehydrogenase, hydrophobic membrane anchor protein [Rhizobiales bacterium]|nr:succinate dehydrogenase, hydrophobic membrane anchor protein [Hyphomicrobiales bacterium]
MSNAPNSLRTPLSRIRHLGSARSGTGHLWAMRVTAVALALLLIAVTILMLTLVGQDYNAVRATMARPLPAILMLAFTLTAAYHMMIGMRTIIEDYVPNDHQREWALIGNALFCGAVALASVYAVLKISFV